MNVFLFGAGASFGSGNVYPTPPPLGNQLFNALERLFPTSWGSLPTDVKDVFRTNFEHGMQEIIDRYNAAIAPLMQHMGIYFSRFRLFNDQSNHYKSLIEHCSNEGLLDRTIFSSLNYECLLEIACSMESVQINYFGDPEKDKAAIYKLHGSCNFKSAGLELSRGVQFSGVTFEGGLQILQPNQVAPVFRGNTGLYPAMSLYAQNKPLNVSPAGINEGLNKWKTHIENASRIIVIGVMPNREDEHLWLPIANSDAEFIFVGGEEQYDNWVNEFRNSKTNKYLGFTWEQANEELLEELSGV
ncbi:MAG: hypothetical protein WD016_05375 [Balneolaceae bacterium]